MPLPSNWRGITPNGNGALCLTGEYVLIQQEALKREVLVTLQRAWVREREKCYHVHLSDLAHIRGENSFLYILLIHY